MLSGMVASRYFSRAACQATGEGMDWTFKPTDYTSRYTHFRDEFRKQIACDVAFIFTSKRGRKFVD